MTRYLSRAVQRSASRAKSTTFHCWSCVFRSLIRRWVGICSFRLLVDRGKVLSHSEEGWLGHLGWLAGECNLLSQLVNNRNDSLHHLCQHLDLVGETEECLDGDNGVPDAETGSRGVSISVRGKRELPSKSEGMRGDFRRVFLAGDSAGANIAHNVLVRTRTDALPNAVPITGLALIHAYFWGKEPVGSEPTDPMFRQWLETTWGFVCGWSLGIDDPRVDPFGDPAILKALPCRRVLVSVTGKDWFRDRGKAYYEKLQESGWEGEAELLETEDEEHVYFLSNPNCDKAAVELDRLASFFTRD
ncbi:hypothetical protein BHM03_00050193 [Ensete ventricosum]|nr:hypothetical protein BHM03_00050193 [Ensete ventricosum]